MNPIIWLSLGLTLITILLAFIALFIKTHIAKIKEEEEKKRELVLSYQNELLKTTLLTQEAERERIAQDLHDGLVSQLNVIRLSKKEEQFVSIHIKECIKTVRTISHDLMPPLVKETPIQDLLYKTMFVLDSKTTSLNTDMLTYHTVALHPDIKLQLIRITQEVTNNIIKYAQATNVNLLLRKTQSHFSMKIEDNGIGFDPSQSQGLGLKSIAARVQLLKGKHKFKNTLEKGSIFLLALPLETVLEP